MKIESQKTTVDAPIEKVYQFLVNTENMKQLLPQDEVKDFKGTPKDCSFKVQGGIVISLEQKEVKPHHEIGLVSGEKSPFPFDLVVYLEEIDGKTEGYLVFDGEVNSFLKMMVKKPLTNLFNHMSNQLKDIFSS